MRPEVDHTLRVLAGKLIMEVGPHVAQEYGRSALEMIAMAMIAAAEEYDRAAEVRSQENRAMRAIFADGARDVPDAGLRSRLATAAAEADDSLRVSALNETNDRLKRLLIELHACVEERPEEWAQHLDRAIWAELRASTQRRAFSFTPL